MKKQLVNNALFFCTLLIPFISIAQYPGQHLNKLSVDTKVPIKAYAFNLANVRLLDGPFKENMKRDEQWIMSIATDRLLHDFRVTAGMKVTSKSLGGWESMDSELRGHTTGHVMSALALLYASTGDSIYKNKGDSLVAGLAQVQMVLNQGGYLSAFPQHLIDRCIAGQQVWAPWYTLHKIMAGLIDMYLYTGDMQALSVAKKMSAWAYEKLRPLTAEQIAVMLKNEFGGMNDAFYNLYSITGNPKDLKLAEIFYNKKLLDPLAAKQDDLGGLHANTQIPKIIGEARGYELTGHTKGKDISDFFWNTVINTQTYATGGNSDKEHFAKPGQLSPHLTGYTQETCNTYNMLKLTRHLFCWTGDEKYMDYYEQALYNDILPQQDPETGMVCYFTPLKAGVFKVYSTRFQSFWCCVGTGFENHAKYGEGIYYHNDKGVFVSLFIPSVLNWKEKGIKIIQKTNYPKSANTNLKIITKSPIEMPLYIRYPSWAVSGASITVNGKSIKIKQAPGSFIMLNRKWKNGDNIEVSFPMSLRLVATPDNPKIAAIAYGPMVLAAPMGKEGIVPPAPFSDPLKHDDYYTYDYKIPNKISNQLNISIKDYKNWIKPSGNDNSGDEFSIKDGTTGGVLTLKPFYEIHRGRYNIYWQFK